MAKQRATKKKYHNKPPKPGTPLTPIQVRVLKWCGKGYSKEEAGPRLGMSLHGVDWHMRQIFIKLRAKNGTHAVYKAVQSGLI
jgi:DNA-binding CsgD family transcriptional regulator